MAPMRRTLPVLLLVLALPATAAGRDGLPTVEQAREGHGATKPATTVAGGDVTISPTEGIASVTQAVEINLRRGGPVDVGFPARFSERALNGRAFVKGTPSSGSVDEGGTLSIDVSGLPAGTYRLALRRAGRRIGTAVFRLYTVRREGEEAEGEERAAGPFGPLTRAAIDSSQDAFEESETFIAVNPANRQRIITSANDIGGSGLGGVSVTSNGAANPPTWSHPSFPTAFDIPGPVSNDPEIPSGDPILAADDQGNLWAGGLSVCNPNATNSRSHIFVHRIAAATEVFVAGSNVALPTLHDGSSCPTNPDDEVIQDKPQMTIDMSTGSPTYGRIYVTWDDPDIAGVNEVLAYCDTRFPLPINLDAARCDQGANWIGPVTVSDGPGSYISSDPAVGPDGKLYVVWWDFSAANAIAIDTCAPDLVTKAITTCGTDKVVASLSTHSTDGRVGRVPFACPTLAQPGGRAAPVPSVAVDKDNRLYVAWGDLGTTGSTRCAILPSGAMTRPDATQDAFNAYVASADTYATLTNDASTLSGARGTNVIFAPGDHWFPWVAVERGTGQAYVALYSTKDDPARRTANFYVRAVAPDSGTKVKYGPLVIASDQGPTNYSDQECGTFGNDYGDYAGLAASSDGATNYALPVWTARTLGTDGDVDLNILSPPTAPLETPLDNPALPPVTQQFLPQCSPPSPTPPAPSTTPAPPPTTTTPVTPPPTADRKPPILKITFATRVDRKGRYTLKLAPAGEAAAGNATLRLATGKKRKLASGLLATSGNKSLKLVIRLKRKDLALLKRKRKLRVKLTVSLTDVAGNTARGSKTFTLRLRR
jgi:hypothetical protein